MTKRSSKAKGFRKTDSVAPSIMELQQVLGHEFKRPELLTLALTHRSFVFDGPKPEGTDLAHPSQDNEQLEFLGDAVLGLVVAEALCQRFPASREGELTKMRAALVSRQNLGIVGTRMDLGRWLLLGPTTSEAGGRTNIGLISNAVEAIIAALYLEGGLPVVRGFIHREILSSVTEHAAGTDSISHIIKDHKTALQELVQAQGLGRVVYTQAGESGPAHQRTFRFAVRLEGPGADLGLLAEAEGSTKKQAQQDAADQALRVLAAHGHETTSSERTISA